MAGSLVELLTTSGRDPRPLASGKVITAGTSAAAIGNVHTASQNVWLKRVQIAVNKVASGDANATFDAVVYAWSGSQWLYIGKTATATITSVSETVFNLEFSPRLPWANGTMYAVVIRALSSRLEVGLEAGDRSWVSGDPGAGTPVSPWAPASSGSTGNALRMDVNGYVNVAPSAAISSPAANASVNTVPTFTVAMTDSDAAEFGDRITNAWLHIVGDSNGQPDATNVKYAPQATALSNANGTTSGSVTPQITLPAATYWVRMAATDRFGATSAFTTWQKLISTASAVIQGTGNTPATKIEALQSGFQFQYSNVSNYNATSVRLELYQGTTRVRRSAAIAVNWTPGSTQTITWAQLVAAGLDGGGTWGDLQWGTEYGYQAIVTDSTGNVSQPSTRRTFRTNAAPATPAIVAPKGAAAASSRPMLRATLGDIDDTTATGLTVTARIFTDAGALLQTRAMTYDSASGEWRYQTTSTDLPSPAAGVQVNYRWDASAYDGTLYSGETTVAANRAWSTQAQFGYIGGQETQIASLSGNPTFGTINPSFQVSWQGANASQVDVRVQKAGTGELVGTWGFSGSTYTSPVTLTIPGQQFGDGQSYDFIGRTIVNGNLGTSAPLTLTLDYPAYAAPLNFAATPFTMDGAPYPSLTQLSWDPTAYAVGQFVRYIVTARPEGEPEGGPNQRTIAIISDPATTMCYDGFPPSGIPQRYTLRQEVRFGNDVIPSDPSERTAVINILGVVLSVANDPTLGVAFLFDGDLPSWGWDGTEDVRRPFGGSEPVTWSTTSRFRTVQASFPLVTDAMFYPMAAIAVVDRVEEIATRVLCWRDRWGRRVFFRIPVGGLQSRPTSGQGWEVSVQGRAEQWIELPAGASGLAVAA